MTIKLEKWGGYYPVMARWNVGSVEYSMVFSSRESAKKYFLRKYYPRTLKFEEEDNEE